MAAKNAVVGLAEGLLLVLLRLHESGLGVIVICEPDPE